MYSVTCRGCGTVFETPDIRKKRCRAACRTRTSESRNGSRTRKRSEKRSISDSEIDCTDASASAIVIS